MVHEHEHDDREQAEGAEQAPAPLLDDEEQRRAAQRRAEGHPRDAAPEPTEQRQVRADED